MIKRAVFEQDIIEGMRRELLHSQDKKQGMQNLDKAGNYLQAALEIFEETGLTSQADAVLNILSKIAQQAVTPDEHAANKGKVHDHPKNPAKDPHTRGLTPQKMVENYKRHGIPFNLADDGKADDLLDADIGNAELEVVDQPITHDFEDEID